MEGGVQHNAADGSMREGPQGKRRPRMGAGEKAPKCRRRGGLTKAHVEEGGRRIGKEGAGMAAAGQPQGKRVSPEGR